MAAKNHRIMDAPPHENPVINEVDNIEYLSTNKALVRCNDCDSSFTSQTVLEAHLQGSRHAKQMRSKVIMASLEDKPVVPFIKNEEKNSLDCQVCNISVNSIQQLQTHLNGNRHKKKATKGNSRNNEKKKLVKKTEELSSQIINFNDDARIIYLNNLIEKNSMILIYCLILFTFACMLMMLTFVFHLFV